MSQWCRSALCGHTLPALTNNWTHGAASRHTIAPISHTRSSPRSRSYYSFPVPLRVGGWVGQVSNLLKVAFSGPAVSRTRNLMITSSILYHYTTALTAANVKKNVTSRPTANYWERDIPPNKIMRDTCPVPLPINFTHTTISSRLFFVTAPTFTCMYKYSLLMQRVSCWKLIATNILKTNYI